MAYLIFNIMYNFIWYWSVWVLVRFFDYQPLVTIGINSDATDHAKSGALIVKQGNRLQRIYFYLDKPRYGIRPFDCVVDQIKEQGRVMGYEVHYLVLFNRREGIRAIY